MTYIYDILLNFTDEERIIEFFEWDENDCLEHIKKMPIIRINTKKLDEIINNSITVEKEFLNRIKGLTILYKKTKNLQYSVLLTDLNKVIGLEFNSKGQVIAKTSLLIDEEDEIIEECFDIKEENINYKINKKININTLTRNEIKKQNYLLKEIESTYKENNIDKLVYLYEEIYNKDNLSIKDKYIRIKEDLINNYNIKHNKLYEIVKLSNTKKTTT